MRLIASAIKGATDSGRTLGEMRTASVAMIESVITIFSIGEAFYSPGVYEYDVADFCFGGLGRTDRINSLSPLHSRSRSRPTGMNVSQPFCV